MNLYSRNLLKKAGVFLAGGLFALIYSHFSRIIVERQGWSEGLVRTKDQGGDTPPGASLKRVYSLENYTALEQMSRNGEIIFILRSKADPDLSLNIFRDKQSGRVVSILITDKFTNTIFIEFNNESISSLTLHRHMGGGELFAQDMGAKGRYDFREDGGIIEVDVDGKVYRGKLVDGVAVIRKDGAYFQVNVDLNGVSFKRLK